MPELLSAPAFVLWGAATSWLELVAFVLALAMVGCNIREIHWGWPLAAVSSLLYFALFWGSRLYGDAALQIFFALVALWGWTQWLSGRASSGARLVVSRLGRSGRIRALLACALLWPLTGAFLRTYTDTDVPWWDAFPTACSVVGQFLLGRKYLENWMVWIVVNLVSVGLFAYKGLWLTVLLYSLFVWLSFVGLRAWQQRYRPVPAQ